MVRVLSCQPFHVLSMSAYSTAYHQVVVIVCLSFTSLRKAGRVASSVPTDSRFQIVFLNYLSVRKSGTYLFDCLGECKLLAIRSGTPNSNLMEETNHMIRRSTVEEDPECGEVFILPFCLGQPYGWSEIPFYLCLHDL